MQPTIGDNVARLRRAVPMTQEALAEASGLSVETIRKLEQNERTTPRLSTLNRLGRALKVPASSLIGNVTRSVTLGEADVDDLALRDLRRILTPARGIHGVTIGGPEAEPPTLDDVRTSIGSLDRAYHADDYATTLAGLPLLIAEARLAVDEISGDDRAAALELMSQTYQLVGTTLIQLRAFDLAHWALAAALDAAEASGNEVIGASAVTTMCWLLLRQGRFDETERLAITTADAIEPSFGRGQPAHLAVWGWLLLRAAAAAVRDNRDDDAENMLNGAAAAAARIGDELPDSVLSPGPATIGTFCRTTVEWKRIESAVIAGQPGRALDLSKAVMPSRRPTSNNRNRHLLDVASAYTQVGAYGDATTVLLGLRDTAPAWLRHQRYARDIVSAIATARKRAMTKELAELAAMIGTEA